MIKNKDIQQKLEDVFYNIMQSNRLGVTVPFVENPEVDMCFRYNAVQYSTKFVQKFTEEELGFLVAHETAHMLYRHPDIYDGLSAISNYVDKTLMRLSPSQKVRTDFIQLSVKPDGLPLWI